MMASGLSDLASFMRPTMTRVPGKGVGERGRTGGSRPCSAIRCGSSETLQPDVCVLRPMSVPRNPCLARECLKSLFGLPSPVQIDEILCCLDAQFLRLDGAS